MIFEAMKKGQTAFFEMALLIMCLTLANSYIPLVHSTATSGFVVPCKIVTSGPAWNGYLAYGLWQFNATGVAHTYLVIMNTNGQLVSLRSSNDWSYWAVKYI